MFNINKIKVIRLFKLKRLNIKQVTLLKNKNKDNNQQKSNNFKKKKHQKNRK